jgi:crotonobetainyl-CoA:carnitine CoA-transferase CaiB-like acyl-CoA transferase
MRFSETPIPHDTAPPTLGQHTAEVLEGVLGLSPAEVAALREAGIV